jgi:CheY-like chemotaxis protein
MKGKNMMKKIMIIDDNEDTLDIFKQLLVDKRFGVSTANNGAAVIEFKGESFDIVITDIDMPWMGCFGC